MFKECEHRNDIFFISKRDTHGIYIAIPKGMLSRVQIYLHIRFLYKL